MDTNNKNTHPDDGHSGQTMSWVIVFILMVAFWPIGLLLLLKKTNVFTRPAKTATKRPVQKEEKKGQEKKSEDPWQSYNPHFKETARKTENAAREFAEDISQAVREASNAARQAAAELNAGLFRQYHQYWDGRPTPEQTETAQSSSQPGKPVPSGKAKAKIKKGRTPLEKKTGKAVSVVLLIISIALFILGANKIAGAARDIWWGGMDRWPDLYLGMFYFVGGLVSFFSRNTSAKRLARYRRYHVFVSGRGIVPIQEIAQAAGLSARVARRDIQAMINEGYLDRGAYIDKDLGCLVLSEEMAEEARQAANDVTEYTAEKTAGEPDTTASGERDDPYMDTILELRRLNSSIMDISISDKTYRIEELTGKIFRIVEEDPEKLPQIRRFTNYYLPTTLKLLRSYAMLEKQGVTGENISTTKESIGRILDSLVKGYEQQLDQLFQSDALDIAADISVLENLMQQDGLG